MKDPISAPTLPRSSLGGCGTAPAPPQVLSPPVPGAAEPRRGGQRGWKGSLGGLGHPQSPPSPSQGTGGDVGGLQQGRDTLKPAAGREPAATGAEGANPTEPHRAGRGWGHPTGLGSPVPPLQLEPRQDQQGLKVGKNDPMGPAPSSPTGGAWGVPGVTTTGRAPRSS